MREKDDKIGLLKFPFKLFQSQKSEISTTKFHLQVVLEFWKIDEASPNLSLTQINRKGFSYGLLN